MAEGDLTTLAKVKAWAGITATDKDALIEDLITTYSAVVRDFIGRDLVEANVTERHHGHGGRTLVLRNWPVVSVNSVRVDDRDIPEATGPWDTGFTYDDHAIYLSGHAFAKGRNNVVVETVAGYATVPPQAAQAVAIAVQAALGQRHRDPNMTSEALPGVSSASYDAGMHLPRTAQAMLEPLRRRI